MSKLFGNLNDIEDKLDKLELEHLSLKSKLVVEWLRRAEFKNPVKLELYDREKCIKVSAKEGVLCTVWRLEFRFDDRTEVNVADADESIVVDLHQPESTEQINEFLTDNYKVVFHRHQIYGYFLGFSLFCLGTALAANSFYLVSLLLK